MGVIGASRRTRLPMQTFGWLLGPRILRTDDPTDMVRTVRAERGFALFNRLTEITCPTLVVGGERDQGYAPHLFRETADGVANGRLLLYPERGHVGTTGAPTFTRDVLAFLDQGTA